MARASGKHRGPRANPTAAIGDWLTLVDPDGAFLTTTELSSVFPHGFERMPADQRTGLRARVADLDDEPATRASLRSWLLTSVLDWDDLLVEDQRIPSAALVRAVEHGATLSPTQALVDVDDANKIRVGVFTWPLGTRLDRRTDVVTAGDSWPASPIQRAETWCRESGVPLALVTDDDQWVLVWAPRGAPAASCRWRISDLADERILQAGLVSLLGARRFFAVADDETLEALFVRAADAEAEITKGLGSSVRRSVELLVAAISRDDVANDGRVLAGVAATEVYESAVTVLMRLVFLLFAEERRLLPAEDPLWAESYSVLTLRDDLRTSSGGDLDSLERRSTAWHRLLATFRAVHGGANHDRLTLPAYGGSLFDPDRFPFLEGRRTRDPVYAGDVDLGAADDAAVGPGRPVAIDDRTVLAILDALLDIKVKSGRTMVNQRVSYKALDVEQIGHCYEGLLDHGCSPVDVLALGLVGPEGSEPEISIADLEAHAAVGRDHLSEWLADKERCNRTALALAKELDKQPEGVDQARLRVACGHNDEVVGRVLPFWGLIRPDLRSLPVVLLPGSLYVTQTSTRRNTGAQYTTKALAEEVAKYALEPLVYEPGPQNEAHSENWRLRGPAAILGLRICDPAVGSGAILTATGRYLADRLIESVVEHGPGEGPFATRLADLTNASADEQVVLARREVVDHCLYGVDKNPVAAEMAKLSLWLTTMARERPFTFLDHAIQVGDSLLGITDTEQLRWLHLDPSAREKVGFASTAVDLRLKDASELARHLQDLSVVTVRDAAEKQRLHHELRAALADLAVVADAVVGAALSTAGQRGVSAEQRLDTQLERISVVLDDDRGGVEQEAALAVLSGVATGWLRTDLPNQVPTLGERKCLHWPLAFPEVFLPAGRTGFDAMVGNPPFLGGKRITGTNGVAYREFLVSSVAAGTVGSADLVVYFILRECSLAKCVGTLATNSVGQGDSRVVGLDQLLDSGWVISRAVRSIPWPNEATLEIAKVWLWRDAWESQVNLEGQAISRISSSLEPERRVTGAPFQLIANSGAAFYGTIVSGLGFVVSHDEAQALVARDHRNAEVLQRYLTGSDLNTDPRQQASRSIINFRDWTLERASEYPDCMDIVRALVKPERDKTKRRSYREAWWRYAEPVRGLYSTIDGLERVLAIALTSKTVMPAFCTADQVFTSCCVFAYDDYAHLGLLSSAVHWWWAANNASTMRTDLRYTLSDVFETFAQPSVQSGPAWERIASVGKALDVYRSQVMANAGFGLTKVYNRVHDPDEDDADIARIREFHVDLDRAVSDAYGWRDLELGHHHWETPQGLRFTVGPDAKDEMLDRLLELNHERYEAEVAAGWHDRKSKSVSTKRRAWAADDAQETLL